jgi:diguanylate cyclase (GGDEF)-like protein
MRKVGDHMNPLVIPILLEKEVNRHTYLIIKDDISILIDPGAKHHVPLLLAALEEHIEISKLSYIVLQSNDYLNLSSLEDLNQKGFSGKVIVNETGVPYLESMISNDIVTIESLDYKLRFGDGQTLEFIPMPFLPFPECYVSIYIEEGFLFSAHLFSHHTENQNELINSINQFHESVLPSIEFVRQAVKKIKKHNIISIYPRLGLVIHKLMIPDVYHGILSYDFYNSNQVVERKNKKNVSYNYETICNHMLKKLETKYHRYEILDAFKDSDIHLELYPHIEIESTKLAGYKLWNTFFDTIYQKKGVSWLTLLEPVVKKYHKSFNIQLPAIYKTTSYLQQSKIEILNVEKKNLEQEVEELSSKITETTDKLLRCPITNLYNQRFMIGHLLNNLDQPLAENKSRCLVLIHIDNLLEINKKYGVHKGDETLRNLVHIINNMKQEDALLFKQNGPGIFVYRHEIDEKSLTALAVKLSNLVKKSELFIEPITITISITSSSELNTRYSLDERVNQFIELAQMRLERAKLKGKDQILDQHTDEKTFTEGIILLVDEDETYQNLMVKIFDRIHYQVIIAKDIYDAYEQLESHNIDVIISEINLTKLDGFQLKQKINQSQSFRNIPFIMVSHHKNLDVVTRCNLLDVDLILQKPIIPEELIGHIKRIRDQKVMIS